jgi:hypothetical protein
LAEVVQHDWLWKYADEDIGSNCGVWRSVEGDLEHQIFTYGRTSQEFALELLGYDIDE